jgi:hypothetical protein
VLCSHDAALQDAWGSPTTQPPLQAQPFWPMRTTECSQTTLLGSQVTAQGSRSSFFRGLAGGVGAMAQARSKDHVRRLWRLILQPHALQIYYSRLKDLFGCREKHDNHQIRIWLWIRSFLGWVANGTAVGCTSASTLIGKLY